MNEATIGGFFETHEGFITAIRRIRAITTHALPHNIDGGKMNDDHRLLLETDVEELDIA